MSFDAATRPCSAAAFTFHVSRANPVIHKSINPFSPVRTLLAAIHGIMTGQTDPSWPDKLDAWMSRRDWDVKILKKEYRAGPFPRWNCWVKDPILRANGAYAYSSKQK